MSLMDGALFAWSVFCRTDCALGRRSSAVWPCRHMKTIWKVGGKRTRTWIDDSRWRAETRASWLLGRQRRSAARWSHGCAHGCYWLCLFGPVDFNGFRSWHLGGSIFLLFGNG